MSVLVPIQRDSRRFDLSAGVGQTSFSFPRPLFDAADLAVSLKVGAATVFTGATGYTVTLTTGGATVDFAVAPRPLGSSPEATVRLEGRRVAARTTDVTRGGALNGPAIDREFDLAAVTLQELRRDIDDTQDLAATAEIAVATAQSDLAAALALRDETAAAVADKIPLSQKGVATGVATLGLDAKVPPTQLPLFVDAAGNLIQGYSPAFTDIVPSAHLRRFSSTTNPVVVLCGDSTSTLFADAVSVTDTLSQLLESEFRRANPSKTITWHNRGIGGKVWASFFLSQDTGLSAPAQFTWINDTSKTWLNYIEELSPDLLVIAHGMNETWNFNYSAMMTIIALTKTWSKVPDIILCSNLTGTTDPDSGFSSAYEQQGRQQAAGATRTAARYFGLGLLDFQRMEAIKLHGYDPVALASRRMMTASAVSLTSTARAGGETVTHWEAPAEFSGRDYSVDVVISAITADFWGDNAATAPLFFRLSEAPSPPSAYPGGTPYNDFLVWRDPTTGRLFWNVRLKRESSGDLTFLTTPQDTGVAAPTSGALRLRFSVRDGIIRLASYDASWVSPTSLVGPVSILRSGGLFRAAFGYDGAANGRPMSATVSLNVGVELNMPYTLGPTDAWGEYPGDPAQILPGSDTRLPWGGNGANHPSSLLCAHVYRHVIENADLRAAPVVERLGAYGVATAKLLGRWNISIGESGVSTLSPKGAAQCIEGLNAVGATWAVTDIGSVYQVVATPSDNESAQLAYNNNTRRWSAVTKKKTTVTVTPGSPGAVVWAGHGATINDEIRFSSTGILPAGLAVNTTYFVQSIVDANTIAIAASAGGAALSLPDAGSGTLSILSPQAYIVTPLTGSYAWSSPPTVAAGAVSSALNVTIPGAQLGDFAEVSYSQSVAGWELIAAVTGTSNVTVYVRNFTASSATFPAGTLYLRVRKRV